MKTAQRINGDGEVFEKLSSYSFYVPQVLQCFFQASPHMDTDKITYLNSTFNLQNTRHLKT